MVIASCAVNARPVTVVPRRCQGSVRAKMAAACSPWVSISWLMVSAPSAAWVLGSCDCVAGELG